MRNRNDRDHDVDDDNDNEFGGRGKRKDPRSRRRNDYDSSDNDGDDKRFSKDRSEQSNQGSMNRGRRNQEYGNVNNRNDQNLEEERSRRSSSNRGYKSEVGEDRSRKLVLILARSFLSIVCSFFSAVTIFWRYFRSKDMSNGDEGYQDHSHRNSRRESSNERWVSQDEYDELSALCNQLQVQQESLQSELRKQASIIEVRAIYICYYLYLYLFFFIVDLYLLIDYLGYISYHYIYTYRF